MNKLEENNKDITYVESNTHIHKSGKNIYQIDGHIKHHQIMPIFRYPVDINYVGNNSVYERAD